ncbi:hypothetical protein FOL47_004000 [Perkinsus chesapeaki]|uniref:Uncharacterized protein n=1 Tax=Perkinsus chesapeaki TaxID=330153 RepID=A0A7J6MZF9_PERCH|nr:hypothetical protein FOL47_004000 [Perkinsus chesapeaki]
MLFRYIILYILFAVAIAAGVEKAKTKQKDIIDDDDDEETQKKSLSDSDIHNAIIAHMRAIQAPFKRLKEAYLAHRVHRARELVNGPDVKVDHMSLARRTANIRDRLRGARASRIARMG